MTAMRSDTTSEPIAIVGIGCRFPGGITDPASFWQFLCSGGDAIAEIPSSRFDLKHFFDSRPATPGRTMSRWGGYLEGIDQFDPEFFGISPREAEYIDPQQRLLLETAWEALEDAGQNAQRLAGSRTAVFIGQWLSDYESRLFSDPERVEFNATLGSGRYAASGRISYVFNLRGPSLTLDTGCSSSLAAVHLAVRSLRSGESTLALAGGVNVILQPHISVAYSQNLMMAPDGHCKFGDARGDGYVRSEGAGLVVLKPLAQAQADGDRIYAVIRGSAVNNDGHSSGILGRPSAVGQEEMLRAAYDDAGVSPRQVGYVEAHGTGTRVGDPVEIAALGAVLAGGRDASQRCFIGSVKTNIGHTEGAAGVAGLIKAALALQHDAIPANLNFIEPNPLVPWSELPFSVPTQQVPWPASAGPRTAGVNSFGIAGTNAHVVLQAADILPRQSDLMAPDVAERALSLLVLSGKTPEALRAVAARQLQQLEADASLSLRDLCWTAATRRTPLEHRAAFVADNRDALIAALRRYGAGEAAAAEGVAEPGVAPKIVFVVPGQGAQWVGMARELMACEPVFRQALERCDLAAREWLDVSLVEQLGLSPDDNRYRLDRIDVIQPALVALAIGYAALWRSLGIEPDAVVGHSMGEVGAAHIAGVLSLDQAMRIICRRSALMRRTSGQGAMALVELAMADAQARLAGREATVSVAVSNSPRSSVISGEPAAVQALVSELEAEGVFCRLVKVDVASHSPQMEPLAAELAAELADLTTQPESAALYSTVLARRAQAAELGASYWAANLRQPVRFGSTVEQLLNDGASVFIELGPHPVLLPSIQQTAQAGQHRVSTIACARRDEPEQAAFLAALGALHCAGLPIDWLRLTPAGGRLVSLPTYPWQRERHWASEAEVGAAAVRSQGRPVVSHHPVLGTGVELAGTPSGAVWHVTLEPARVPAWFAHRVQGRALLPESAYIDLALAAAQASSGTARVELVDLRFDRGMPLPDDAAAALQIKLTSSAEGVRHIEFHSADKGVWTLHSRAQLRPADANATPVPSAASLAVLRDQPALTPPQVYARLEASGLLVHAGSRLLSQAWCDIGRSVLATLDSASPPPAGQESAHLIDACLQAARLLVPGSSLWAIARVSKLRQQRLPVGDAWVHASLASTSSSGGAVSANVLLFDAEGVVVELNDVALQPAGAATSLSAAEAFYSVEWAPLDTAPAAPTPRAWALLPDTQGVAECLLGLLRRRGETAQMLAPGLSPEANLFAMAEAMRLDVVDLRALDVADAEASLAGRLHQLVQTVQRVGQLPSTAAARLWLVTRGARALAGDDVASLSLAQAPVWGLGAVVAAELGDRWGGNVDLDATQAPQANAAGLLAALDADRGSIAVRGGACWQPVLRRAPASLPRPMVWRKDASYLITGGLGGVGRHVAEGLVADGVRHLVVMGRTPLPERAQWRAVDAASPAGQAIAALKRLEAGGASVHHVALDVVDPEGLRDWLDRFNAEGRPPVRGVFHAAGITDNKLLRDLDASLLSEVLRPKVLGALNLHRLLPELDCFVLFSSLAAVVPQAGQASYAAANAFLDALAISRRAQGQHALSVGWGEWARTGVMSGELGARQSEEMARQGYSSFSPDQAVGLLRDALSQQRPHLLALAVDWARMRSAHGKRTPPLLREMFAGTADAVVVPDHSTTADPAERRRALERTVREVVGRVLKLAPAKIDARKPLGTMGLTSLMALELRNRLEPLHGKPLSATLAWNYPTVEALVGFLAEAAQADALLAAPEATAAAAPSPSAAVAAALSEVNQLSDADAARLLRKRR